ncbi:MAG: restriction endonuclease [Chloroflexi bacterium]|nr:restriction endonuclease [Chloroflexota bacterium]
MSKAANWKNLTGVEFEKLVYDLLGDLGYQDVDWRKGTAADSTSPDSGIDIEAQLKRKDPDGDEYFEKWAVQVKHHVRAVSWSELQSAFYGAKVGKPDVLLLVVSSHLTNPCKDQLRRYLEKESLAYRVRIWEGPKIEKLLSQEKSNSTKQPSRPVQQERQLPDPIAASRAGPEGDQIRKMESLRRDVDKALRM